MDAGASGPVVVTAAEMVPGHVALDISCLDRLYPNTLRVLLRERTGKTTTALRGI